MYVYQKHLAGEVTSRERELGRRGPSKARVKLDGNNAFLQEVNDNTHTHARTHARRLKFTILNSSVIAFRKFMQTTAWKYWTILKSLHPSFSEKCTAQTPIVFIGHLENVSSAATRASSNK